MIIGRFSLIVLVFALIGCDQSAAPVNSDKNENDVVSLSGCRSKGVTTIAKFEMRGNDQILRLKCGTEKIPDSPGVAGPK